MSHDEGPASPEPGNRKRISGGSVTSASETQAWNKLYASSETEWRKTFRGMEGHPLRLPTDLDHPWYKAGSGGNICADSHAAFLVAVRTNQVLPCFCNFEAPPAAGKSEADVSSHIRLLISCIQSCNINNEEGVIQHDRHDPPASGDSDELQAETSAAESPANATPHPAEQPLASQTSAPKIPENETRQMGENPEKHPAEQPLASQTSEDAQPAVKAESHVSGSHGSLPGPGILDEQRRFKLDGREVIADMTITCQETALPASSKRLPSKPDDAVKSTNKASRWIVIATVEVKAGSLTLSDLRQSSCQGIAAALSNRIEGSVHRTRSILINARSMIVVEYELDDSYIQTVIDNGLAVADIPTNQIKGKFAIIYAGPFDFSLRDETVREVFVGLIAPSFRSRIDRAKLLDNLATMLRKSARDSVATFQHSSFSVPSGFKKTALPDDDDTTAADALWVACLGGKVPELREVKGNKRKRGECEDDVAANRDKESKLLGDGVAAQAKSKLDHNKPLRQAVFTLRDPYRHIRSAVKNILGTANLSTFSMSDLLARFGTLHGDITNLREIIESTAIEFAQAQLDQGPGLHDMTK